MKKIRIKTSEQKAPRVIADYDAVDTSDMIDRSKRLKYEDIGLKLPKVPPTQVISIRLPSALLNNLRAISSETDIPYQALIKLFLSDSVARFKKKSVPRRRGSL
jgi:predicted DNA binding CopG/RHH family protein